MSSGTIEIYHPRNVSNLNLWEIGDLKLKVYGLVAADKEVDGSMVTLPQSFVRRDVRCKSHFILEPTLGNP
ncbi:hypothetical protein QEZ47_00235 [Aminobacter anthyllidis]|uniref:hypothetical protein n=1 Tax=Aminobacter anthyllidis TaxID=1035067 RepID=UPI00245627DD|nr:hypothetical protein [Aminobacter anthyllidis]MDH4984009.1 hypothetical protein [Aminobacter anthyllidis]